jgi:maltooligosyltrehalose trehalohydrolase
MEFGAKLLGDGRCRFSVWAPEKSAVSVVLLGGERKAVKMIPGCGGFHSVETAAAAGSRYVFRMPDGREFPDPASRFQPEGVHGPSSVADLGAFEWEDEGFVPRALREAVIYEMHAGAFTPEGTFAAAIPRLRDLSELGVTAVELMPVAQFPGSRNWGYDGVYPYAVQNSYGGPEELQRFVNAAHRTGLSVILDVVYNHLGPEGNYFGKYGPFFTGRYSTPWGQAVNFDGACSDAVREFFIQNALYWFREFHIDALRLDAVHGIFDFSARHFLAELQERVRELASETNRTFCVIAESDLNDARLLHAPELGGYGLDAQWSDDFHHALHALLTQETTGYYGDFGSLEDLGVTIQEGWLYSGQYSQFRKRHHGNSPAGIAPERFVVFDQNHDQVGNRAFGERLSTLVDFDSLKLAAGVALLSPFVPLLFMGEEYGEARPFQYFTSHEDPDLVDAVRRGRRQEFSEFGWSGDLPDPQDEATFEGSKLDYDSRNSEPHRSLREFYRALIALRRKCALGGTQPEVEWDEGTEALSLVYEPAAIRAIFHFGNDAALVSSRRLDNSAGIVLNSAAPEFAPPAAAAFDARIEGAGVRVARRSVTVLKTKSGQWR